jgi:diaminopimelate decarboxylase
MVMNTPKIIEAVASFGTPLFLYDETELERNYRELRDALPQQVELYYSMKSNPNPYICKRIYEWGSLPEVASIGEYMAAADCGIPTDRIIFTGPGKNSKEIRQCLTQGILAINVESIQELEVINREAARLGRVAPVLIRVNLNLTKSGSRMASAGLSGQFGVDEDQLWDVIQRIKGMDHVRLQGLHNYQGTQNFRLDAYEESIPLMFKLVHEVNQWIEYPLTTLGLGGGYGVPHFADDAPFPIRDYSAILAKECARNRDLNLTRIFVESGRFITARMGSYITSALYTKSSRGKRYIITDGGTHHRAFSTLMGRSFKPPILPKVLQDQPTKPLENSKNMTERVTLTGKLCTPTDILIADVDLPCLSQGDLIVFPNSGAYGLTSGNVHFLSHGLPPEVILHSDGTLENINWLTRRLSHDPIWS